MLRYALTMTILGLSAGALAGEAAHAQQGPPGGPGGPGGGPVQVTAVRNLEFGPVVAGGTYELVGGEPTLGVFLVEAPPNRDVRLEFDLPQVLPGTGQPNVAELAYPTGSAAWSETEDFSAAEPFDPSANFVVTMPQSGEIYVRLGAVLSVDEDAWAGPASEVATLHADPL